MPDGRWGRSLLALRIKRRDFLRSLAGRQPPFESLLLRLILGGDLGAHLIHVQRLDLLDHLVEGITQGHAAAVLAASIFHFGTYTIAQAKAHMRAAGIPVRP